MTSARQNKKVLLYTSMQSKQNTKVVTRDMPSKGEGMLTTYNFPTLGVTVEATTLQEAQAKAEAKAKALNK